MPPADNHHVGQRGIMFFTCPSVSACVQAVSPEAFSDRHAVDFCLKLEDRGTGRPPFRELAPILMSEPQYGLQTERELRHTDRVTCADYTRGDCVPYLCQLIFAAIL